MLDLSVEKRVSSNMAVASVILSIVGILGTAIGFFGFMGAMMAASPLGAVGGGGILVISLFLGVIGTIMQLIVVYQWAGALNANLANLRLLLQHLVARAGDETERVNFQGGLERLTGMRISMTLFWGYVLLHLAGFFLPGGAGKLLGFVAFVFIALYLNAVFKLTDAVQELRQKLYAHVLGEGPCLPPSRIRHRNLFLSLIFMVLTLGIYWLFLLYNLTFEINAYLDDDQAARSRILQELA
ncbi:MAG: hypothetical protein ACC613_02125 [Synergistales bacterium]|jgi:hypothetical protein